MATILLVEDDESARRSLAQLMKYAGYHVHEAATGEAAQQLLTNEQFDVVIADIILGGGSSNGLINGIEVLRIARQQLYQPEVIILTGHGSLDTAIMALREGAIDYLLKPCSGTQLRAAVERALHRYRLRQQMRAAAEALATVLYGEDIAPLQSGNPPTATATYSQPREVITIGVLALGPTRREVSFAGQAVHLTSIEYLLLRYLAHYAGQICSATDIVRFVHGTDCDEIEARALVKPHIHNLRKKLPASCLVTERGLGYRLIVPDD